MKCDYCEQDFPHYKLRLKNKHYFCDGCLDLLGEEWNFCRNCGEPLPDAELNKVGLCDSCNDAFREHMISEVCSECEENREECRDEKCWLSSMKEWCGENATT